MLIQDLILCHQDRTYKKKLRHHWKCSLHIADIHCLSCSLQRNRLLNGIENGFSGMGSKIVWMWKFSCTRYDQQWRPWKSMKLNRPLQHFIWKISFILELYSKFTIFAVIFWCWTSSWYLVIWTASTGGSCISTESVLSTFLTSAFSHVVSSRARGWMKMLFQT